MNNQFNEPIFVGGFPGSGTRIFSRILEKSGIFMGSYLSKANDSKDFAKFLNNWVGFFLKNQTPQNYEIKKNMEKDFSFCLKKHLEKFNQKSTWGSKNPRNILILPFLHSKFPKMKYLHIIRDGRDILYSTKKYVQVKKYGPQLIGKSVLTPVDFLDLWRCFNEKGETYGSEFLKERYMQIKFEDICLRPKETIMRLFRFVNISDEKLDLVSSEVVPPKGAIGRWKQHEKEFKDLSELSKSTLARFGYIV